MPFVEIEKSVKENAWSMHALHSHPHYEIYFLCKGSRSFFLSNAFYKVEAPVVIVIPPHVMHKTEGGPYERINVYLSDDLLDESERKFLSSCSSILSFELENSKKNMLFSLFRPFLEETDKEDLLKKKYSLSFAKTFLYILQSSTLTPLSYAPSISKNNTNKNLILDIVSYINTHFQENITLESLKNKFFISKNTLCKNFQQVMHCSVMEYCSAARLNEAKHLLLTTTKSIEDIADLCGYSSANYFSLLFKSKTGLAPSTYRKKK